MNKETLKNAVIVLLLTVTIISIFNYVSSLKDKRGLLDTLNQVSQQVAILGKEKQKLSDENAGLAQDLEKGRQAQERLMQGNLMLKGHIKASGRRLAKLFSDYSQAKEENQQLNSKFSLLKAENSALAEEKGGAMQEIESLKVKLSSITELRKAISELKRKPKGERAIEGNRGFLIKDGQATYPAKVKIEVIPASRQEK